MEADDGVALSSETPARVLAAFLGVLSLAGIGAAGYLTYVHWFDKPIVCAGFSSCRQVADSSYAWIHGIPVAFFGLLGYIALAALPLRSGCASATALTSGRYWRFGE